MQVTAVSTTVGEMRVLSSARAASLRHQKDEEPNVVVLGVGVPYVTAAAGAAVAAAGPSMREPE